MSLKQEIETWVEALARYDNNEFEEALKTFDNISDTSKILFNCGIIHATLGEHDKAVECYLRAVGQDQYLAVAYFQQGVSNFLVGDFEEALANFNDTLGYLRGNTFINYEQLGLKFKLFSCEVLFNRGLCYIYLQQKAAGMGDLSYAVKEKVTPDHDVIDEAIKEEADGYTVFSIPIGVLYRPNSAKVKNLKTKDYLGKARLIAAADKSNVFTGFAGSETKKIIPPIETSRDDRPLESISFAASNLVKTDLPSRTRQQSAPPINRNMFPPTPPPDSDQNRPPFITTQTSPASNPPSLTGRASSVRNPPTRSESFSTSANRPTPSKSVRNPTVRSDSFSNAADQPNPFPANTTPSKTLPSQAFRPEKLDAQIPRPKLDKDLPRLGTLRTASEPRGPSTRYPGPRSQRDRDRDYPPSRGRLFMEAIHSRREDGGEAEIDEYPDELYDMYSNSSYRNPNPHGNMQRTTSARTRPRSRSRQRPRYVEEEPEDPFSPSTHSSLDDFEILNNAGGAFSRPPREDSRSRGTSRSRRPPEIRNIRIKVHSGDDTRYIMVDTMVRFEEFMDRVREKLGIQGRFKVKVKDEGDFITVGDRDDWDLATQGCRQEARKEGGELGKME
ncbi:hypothetical protein MMC06_004997, partial [Schaereria dolodes]|nr:hypothetical protein [Schaereria dolodes]